MEYLINRFGFKAIYFDDDIFNVDKKHVLEVCGEMKKYSQIDNNGLSTFEIGRASCRERV